VIKAAAGGLKPEERLSGIHVASVVAVDTGRGIEASGLVVATDIGRVVSGALRSFVAVGPITADMWMVVEDLQEETGRVNV
jgi:hypothetical protein